MNSVPRALRAFVRSTELLEVRENAKYTADKQKQSKYAGKDLLLLGYIFEKFFGLGFRPAGGCGRNAGRKFFWFFLAGTRNSKTLNSKLSRYFFRYVLSLSKGVHPCHPHSTLCILMFVVSLSLLNYSTSINFGAHPLAMDAHSGNARGGIQMLAPSVCASTHTRSAHPCTHRRGLPNLN